ncbi:MAG TPA: hypothetical protein VJT73_20960, partial [Polyangiaceae bacterium]|nr:hypothetical protein [Polyangiaceae bacterium]
MRHGWVADVRLFAVVAATAALLLACTDERYPQAAWDQNHPGRTLNPIPPTIEPPRVHGACVPARSMEPLPARIGVISGQVAAGERRVFTTDLYLNRFKPYCGSCHVDGQQGGKHVSSETFATEVSQEYVDAILSADPAKSMPPLKNGGKLASERPEGDPVLALAKLLQIWIDQGRPNDVFYLPAEAQNGASPYLMTEDLGESLTNIGDCVPPRDGVATQTAKMTELDLFFASLEKSPPGVGSLVERIGLPPLLSQTDLFTLDGDTLARHGVIAYAPLYPLWADNARKLRHVRVPVGQSIHFNRETQQFEIPPNTRFYKTFLKRIVDIDGNESYRKMETRLIVVRPDVDVQGCETKNTALFGTYVWNEEETQATLLAEPLRDGEPFVDSVVQYTTNELVAAQVVATKPRNVTYALEAAHALRHYAIPGSQRCVQCHMGSAGKNFILGFTPLQIRRRPVGEGGVIEPSGDDELNQLERLIEYGLVTGLDGADEIAPLEDSQGTRKPRNEHELAAQGYLLGNCAHCHNPRGFPSVSNPVLVDIFNLMPGPQGGIFQFPLETMSPRISRGPSGSVRIPYITPSLVDYPVPIVPSIDAFYVPKHDFTANVAKAAEGSVPRTILGREMILAPWRSLVYRNVDTPFTYADDASLFPHMPMNTPGFDCRAPRIMANWMVSIPARRKRLNDYQEYAVPVESGGHERDGDDSEQPYVEVKPGEKDYETAVEAAQQRLQLYEAGVPFLHELPTRERVPSRYRYCPDTSDIVDPDVVRYPDKVSAPTDSDQPTIMPRDGVPDRPHWVVTDLTDSQGDWAPRRPDWPTQIVTIPPLPAGTENLALIGTNEVANMLQSVKLEGSHLKEFVQDELPFGLWQTHEDCDFSSTPKASQFKENKDDERAGWMREPEVVIDPNAPVYIEHPGAAVFNLICVNCHGPEADSRGRQADILMTMTGGRTRVANLRDGLFGPVGNPGSQRASAFSETIQIDEGKATSPVGADDMAARYLAWMGSGGTNSVIPPAILQIVANTEVLGQKRSQWSYAAGDANMLGVAKELCR